MRLSRSAPSALVVSIALAAACNRPPDLEKVPVGTDVQLTRDDGGVVRPDSFQDGMKVVPFRAALRLGERRQRGGPEGCLPRQAHVLRGEERLVQQHRPVGQEGDDGVDVLAM